MASDATIHAVIPSCNTNDHSEDSICVEDWKKECKGDDSMLVPLIKISHVDTFETPYFVYGLYKEMDNDLRRMNNAINNETQRQRLTKENLLQR